MTVRGFLAWYLGTVAMVSASGAVMWQDIQARKQLETALAPVTRVAEAPPPPIAAEPVQDAEALPVPPVPAVRPPAPPARVASTATRPPFHAAKPRQTVRVARRAAPYRGEDPEPYPRYAAGYVTAYPPGVMTPWQPYPRYDPYRRYYPRYPYYPAY